MKVLMLIVISIVSVSCVVSAKRVGLEFDVRDDDGNPIDNAKVQFHIEGTSQGPGLSSSSKTFSCETDINGYAAKHFGYVDGVICGGVSKSGYYTDVFRCKFATSYDPKTDVTTYLETNKTIRSVLKRRINPIPLFAYRNNNRFMSFGRQEAMIGYDLKKGDWLPPDGVGEVADFWIHHRITETNGLANCLAELRFEDGAGAYIVRGKSKDTMPIVYCAETNATYKTNFGAKCIWDCAKNKILSEELVLSPEDTLVIRSRVTKDENGNIIEANYSKIYGPLRIARFCDYNQRCFNPTVNDINLEYDTGHNLSGQRGGTFRP